MFEFLFGIDTLLRRQGRRERFELVFFNPPKQPGQRLGPAAVAKMLGRMQSLGIRTHLGHRPVRLEPGKVVTQGGRSEEHTSELQSLMRISYAVFCSNKKTNACNIL